MRKGNAYRAADGSVYFKVSSFPEYGALSRVKERELKVTNSVFDADHKDDVGDFALWKAHKPAEDGDVKWPGPEGAAVGRPGWHIECSAMIKRHHRRYDRPPYRWRRPTALPASRNEIAQKASCCNGAQPFLPSHWFHTEHLLVDGTTARAEAAGNYYTRRLISSEKASC